MSGQSSKKELSLKWLELFEVCARAGTLQAVADETGLSVSTVSHHLRNLEDHLGVELFNHSKRPMVLTPKGHVFLRNIEPALYSIRRAKAEASAGNLSDVSYLRVGTVEDLDSDISPDLAVFLSQRLPRCDFLYHTGSSQAITDMLRNRRLDLGVAGSAPERIADVRDFPLLRDPLVVALPRSIELTAHDVVHGTTGLPLLRFSSNLIIARYIEAHLRRTGVTAKGGFECSNNQTLMAMVAAGAGWTITTPLLFARAKRFQSSLRLHPFPGKSFARTLSLLSTPDCSASVLDLVNQKLRSSIEHHAIAPLHAEMPWLRDSFILIE